jgi:DNA-binding SARP family transcriptional activator
LIGALWGEGPPSTALPALRNYVSRLRKTFGTHAETALLSVSGGYSLQVEDGAFDLDMAESYAAQAGEARLKGEHSTARHLLNAALELWRGETLAGVPGPYAQAQRAQLEKWRLQLLESRLEMDLATGRHTGAVSELIALIADHPLRERLRSLLMLALCRCGRQGDALAVYSETRKVLAEELGVDPCREIAELHQKILEGDALLSTPEERAGGNTAKAPGPSQLRSDTSDFTGSSHRSRTARATGAWGSTANAAFFGAATASSGRPRSSASWEKLSRASARPTAHACAGKKRCPSTNTWVFLMRIR